GAGVITGAEVITVPLLPRLRIRAKSPRRAGAGAGATVTVPGWTTVPEVITGVPTVTGVATGVGCGAIVVAGWSAGAASAARNAAAKAKRKRFMMLPPETCRSRADRQPASTGRDQYSEPGNDWKPTNPVWHGGCPRVKTGPRAGACCGDWESHSPPLRSRLPGDRPTTAEGHHEYCTAAGQPQPAGQPARPGVRGPAPRRRPQEADRLSHRLRPLEPALLVAGLAGLVHPGRDHLHGGELDGRRPPG